MILQSSAQAGQLNLTKLGLSLVLITIPPAPTHPPIQNSSEVQAKASVQLNKSVLSWKEEGTSLLASEQVSRYVSKQVSKWLSRQVGMFVIRK